MTPSKESSFDFTKKPYSKNHRWNPSEPSVGDISVTPSNMRSVHKPGSIRVTESPKIK